MSKKSRTKNSVRNFSAGMLNETVQIILKIVCRTVFVYTLGKSFLGINGIFSDVLSMLSLAELGIASAINFKLYKPLAENDTERLQALMKFYKAAYRIIGLVILILGVALIPFLPFLIKDYDKFEILGLNAVVIYLLYLFKTVLSYWLFAYRSAIIRADQKQFVVELSDMISLIVVNLLQIILLLCGCDFLVYTIVAIGGSILKNIINAIYANKYYPEAFAKSNVKMEVAEIKDMFKDIGALFVNKLNTVILKATDNLVLSAFIGLDIVGLYSNYLLIFLTIRSLIQKMYKATHASMGNLFTTADDSKKISFFETMNFVTAILYGTAAVGIFVTTDELLTVWLGADYVIVQPFAMLIGLEMLFSGVKANLNQIRTVSGLFRQKWMRPLLGIVINVVASVVLVQFWGIYGVICGTILADFCANFLVDPSVIYKNAFHGTEKVWKYYLNNTVYFLIIAAVGCLDMFICSNALVGMGWFSLIIHILICAVSVPAVFVLCYFKTDRFIYIKQLFLSLIRKRRKG